MTVSRTLRDYRWMLPCVVMLTAEAAMAFGGPCVPPPNEDCDGAIVLGTVDLPFSVTAPLGCFNDIVDKPYFDVFYRYDCTVTAEHLLEMCDSLGDTYLRIYTGGCGWASGIELATADDECPGSPPNADPLLSIVLEAGTTYWIELGTWRPDPPWAPPLNSPYHFSLSLPGVPTPTSCDGTGISTVLVDDPGNPPDTNGAGSVAEVYRVGRYEVTNAQWVACLNAVAADDPNGLFNQDMTDSDRGGIIRGGSPGSFVYFLKASFGDKPVAFVSWPDAARYCNWLHNGQPVGAQGASTTESGAYDLSLPNDQITRLPGAKWFLPTHDEWYKAAYYDRVDPGADGGGTPNYWSYPTRSDTLPTQATADAVGNVANPGVNVANYGGGADWNGENGNVTTVGSTTSTSPWGVFDMGGNVLDWTETPDTPIAGRPPLPTRTARGGDFANAGILMSSLSGFALAINMVAEAANVGFRVAAVLCPGDFDGDNDVDEDDFDAFESCFTGPDGGPQSRGCTPGDFDGDDDIDCDDWALFVASWTLNDPPTLCFCNPADTNGDGAVNVLDLIDVLLCFGQPAEPGCAAEDINQDGTVNVLDLIDLLLSFGASCP